jgi:aspartate/methionine/tyrosine aminotransferase
MNRSTRTMSSTYLEWAKLRSQAKYNLASSGILDYSLSELLGLAGNLEINGPTAYGYEPLLERLARTFGVGTESIVTTQGTAMANHFAMAAVLSPGDEVIVESPTYGPMLEVASYLGARILRFDRLSENAFRIDPDQIGRKMTARTRMIVLTNLHNPSGAFTDEATLAAIGEIAAKSDAWVLVDEVYLDLVFDRRVRSAFHLGPHFIVTSSLTKAYGLSGLRCGWILAEPNLSKRIWRLNDLFGATPVHVGELLSVIALDHLEEIAERAKRLLDRNRRALNRLFDTRGELLPFRPRWGTVSFPKLKRGSVEKFDELLRTNYDTSIVPGRFFEMPEHFRIGIGGDPEMTAKGLDRLAAALDAYAER